jgi:AraC-like DNA-binding protein
MRILTNSIERWREEICRHLLTLDFEPASEGQFRGSILGLVNANGVRVTEIGHTPGHSCRDQRLAKDGTDTLALLFATGGAMHVSHCGREVQLRSGGATLLRNREPGKVALSREGKYTAVLIPNGALQNGHAIDALVGRRLPETTALNLIKSYISSLKAGHDPADSELARLASGHLIELARLALAAGAERAEEAEPESIREVRLRVALELISKRHRESDLCVNDIAAAQGISTRYLQKLLEGKGISFSSHVNDLRLQTAHAALRQRETQFGNIAEIAFSCGFRDLSYFNRLFRRHFGDTPTGVRSARDRA